jgi:membrane-bound ClpP family serine protease
MNLDIRIPMGLMFAILGVVLTVYGAISHADTELYKKSLGVNINFWWGLVMLAFALVMLGLAWRAGKKVPATRAAKTEERQTPGAGH